MAQQQLPQQQIVTTLSQRFENESQYGKFWVYLDGSQRFKTGQFPDIPTGQRIVLTVEQARNGTDLNIKSWAPVTGLQTVPEPSGQGSGASARKEVDWDAIAEKKTRCALIAPLGPVLFSELPEDQRTVSAACEIAQQLFDYVYNGL